MTLIANQPKHEINRRAMSVHGGSDGTPQKTKKRAEPRIVS